jgi:hypothetical protein
VKVARTVLRGERRSDTLLLPGQKGSLSMYNSDWGNKSRSGLTRISVTGMHNGFLVRTGGERARVVRNLGDRLVCECGAANCAHVEAVLLCGFVEGTAGEQQAA